MTQNLEFERGLATLYDFEGPERVSIDSVPGQLKEGTIFVAWLHQEELKENWAFVLRRGSDPMLVPIPSLDAKTVQCHRSSDGALLFRALRRGAEQRQRAPERTTVAPVDPRSVVQ